MQLFLYYTMPYQIVRIISSAWLSPKVLISNIFHEYMINLFRIEVARKASIKFYVNIKIIRNQKRGRTLARIQGKGPTVPPSLSI